MPRKVAGFQSVEMIIMILMTKLKKSQGKTMTFGRSSAVPITHEIFHHTDYGGATTIICVLFYSNNSSEYYRTHRIHYSEFVFSHEDIS